VYMATKVEGEDVDLEDIRKSVSTFLVSFLSFFYL